MAAPVRPGKKGPDRNHEARGALNQPTVLLNLNKENPNMIKSDDTGKLILRLTLGILILLHGLFKPLGRRRRRHRRHAVLARPAGLSLPMAPTSARSWPRSCIIVGIYTRLGGLIIAINMVVASHPAGHTGQLGSLTNNGGWALELQGMFLFTALAIAFMGAGRFSLAGNGGRWN